jgi:hypothetical protein
MFFILNSKLFGPMCFPFSFPFFSLSVAQQFLWWLLPMHGFNLVQAAAYHRKLFGSLSAHQAHREQNTFQNISILAVCGTGDMRAAQPRLPSVARQPVRTSRHASPLMFPVTVATEKFY